MKLKLKTEAFLVDSEELTDSEKRDMRKIAALKGVYTQDQIELLQFMWLKTLRDKSIGLKEKIKRGTKIFVGGFNSEDFGKMLREDSIQTTKGVVSLITGFNFNSPWLQKKFNKAKEKFKKNEE